MLHEEKLNYEDFFEYVWDYVSEKIIGDSYWHKNQQFIRAISSDLYKIYKKEDSPNVPKFYAHLIESWFVNMFKYQPHVYNSDIF